VHPVWWVCQPIRGLHSDTALASPWKSLNFFQIFKTWKVLANRHGPWKSLNLCLKVLESAWIWFSKTPWPNQSILKKVFQMASFWPQMCIKYIFGRGFAPDPAGEAYDTYMLIKVPVWFNLVLFIYPSLYGPWKSLKSPWIWFWQMGKNPAESSLWFITCPVER